MRVIELLVTALPLLRKVVDTASGPAAPEGPLLQPKEVEDVEAVGVEEVVEQKVCAELEQPSVVAAALRMGASTLQVFVRPRFEEQVTRPLALRLQLDAVQPLVATAVE